MPPIDTESLLQPVLGTDPTGVNLEYDPAFAELERNARGKPEQQIGDSVVAGEPADWNAVQNQAAALLSRSKDLRIGVHLLRALLHRQGFEGLSEGLAVVRGMLERFWAPLHPQLDPDDANDPAVRVNALALLSDPEMVMALRAAPVIRSRSFGVISLRDIAVATGESPPAADGQKLEMAALEAAFLDCSLAELEITAQSLRSSFEHFRAIESLFDENAGVSGPDVAALERLLRQAEQFVLPRLERRRAAENGAEAPAADGTVHTNGSRAPTPMSGEIRSRDDVVRALDKICDYYARHEPSSPLPLLLQRCKRLATMSFIEIVREMVPDGLPQVELIAGKRDES